MAGMSVRVSYGINRLLAFEGELGGASSGDVRFAGMMFNNTPGELTRSAAFGRAQFGGLLTLGHRFITTARLGIGFQGAR